MLKRIFIGFVVAAGVLIGVALAVSGKSEEGQKKDELFRQVSLFSDTLAIIQSEYVDEISPKNLIYGALKGMLSSLDAHSQFLDPDTYNELKVDTKGKFGGLGIEITIKDGLLTVITAIEDTPAWKAGLKANDRIVKINDELTRDITLLDAVKKMRGKVGEPVNLTILRESEKKVLEFKIIRDIIKIKEVKDARILEDGIGYLKLVEFSENTPQEFDVALENLSKAGMSAFILDLRNNPGGLLDVAVKVCERFIEKGKMIVYTKGRQSSQSLKFIARQKEALITVPMVVLINEGSASGSEIVAACLQDYKRAIVVGTKSFGKGSVQTVLPLSDGSAIRLTTSKYFTPLGKVIHGKGVSPDIVVEEGKFNLKPELSLIKEKGEDIFEQLEEKEKKDPEGKSEDKALDYRSDSQLMRSVDILKGIIFYKSQQATLQAK